MNLTLTLVNIGIIVTYALLGIAVFGAIGSGVRGFITSPKGGKMALFGILGIAVVILVAFGLSSSSDVSEVLLQKTETPQWWVRPVGAGLISFYILFIGVFALLIATEAMRPFKK